MGEANKLKEISETPEFEQDFWPKKFWG